MPRHKVNLALADNVERREIIIVRGQAYVSRLPKYWPPPPSPPGECVLHLQQSRGDSGGGHTRRAERGVNILEDARHRIGLLQ
jgi:hypothetical protein